MNRTFYLDFNDLDIDKQEEIREYVEQWVEEQLKQEGREELERLEERSINNVEVERTWKIVVKDLYDFETDQDINNHIMEKAEDIIQSQFKTKPIEIELSHT